MKSLTIGQVARLAGVGVETVRYYERRQLLEQPARRASGYRQYSPDAVNRIRFIRRAKHLGFALREIKELLKLRDDSRATCADLREATQAKAVEAEKKIKELQRIHKELKKLIAACPGCGPLSQCPILRTLEAATND